MSFTDKLMDKIEVLAATPGRNDKLVIVKGFSEAERNIFRLALDPTRSYYIAELDPTPNNDAREEWWDLEFELLDDLASRVVTGNAALQRVQGCLEELSPKSAELLRRVILRDMKCGVGVTMMNTAFPGLVPDFPYMRCTLPKDSNMSKWIWGEGIYSQLKANGSFARIDVDAAGKVQITTRQGNTYPDHAIRTLQEEAAVVFPANTQTHGELTVYDHETLLPRAIGNGLLNSLMQGGALPDDHEVRFDAWDQIPLDKAVVKGAYSVFYEKRFKNLTHQIECTPSKTISLIESRLVNSEKDAKEHYREVLRRGLEGTVLKHYTALWKDGNNKDQVKLKLEVDVDLEIAGFRAGTVGSRTEATFGSVMCQTSDGLLEVAVSGFNREMEQYIHENRDSLVGKVMCVKANEVSPPSDISPLHSLFHPRFVELRSDKFEADTLQQVLDQFAASVA